MGDQQLLALPTENMKADSTEIPVIIGAHMASQTGLKENDRVTLRWQMPEHTEAPLLEQLRELTRGSAQVTVSDPFYAPF